MKIVVEILNPTLAKDLIAAGYSDIPFFIAKGFGCKETDIKVTDYHLQNPKLTKGEAAKALFEAVAEDYLS